MYKDMITSWSLHKYLRQEDAEKLLAIKEAHATASHTCLVLRHGFLVDAATIEEQSTRGSCNDSWRRTLCDRGCCLCRQTT